MLPSPQDVQLAPLLFKMLQGDVLSPEADSKSLTFLIQGFLLGTFATTDDAPGDGFKDVLPGAADADVVARRWVSLELSELSRG